MARAASIDDQNTIEGHDTIVAIATPPGRGGLGILRFSGPHARAIAEPLLQLTHPLAPGRARFAHLLDPTQLSAVTPVLLDQAVVTFFAAPHSYTGEDVLELSVHGSPVLLDTVLRYALAQGARLAQPGEFTQRAFLSGRLDLTAAEAVRDLIDASTLHQARIAAAQLGGSISQATNPIKRALIHLIAAIEAGLDFAEDDIDTLPAPEIAARLAAIEQPLRSLAASFTYGRTVREGFRVALAGQPNAGKSSLFNRLLGRDRAIVTAQPGTTRDLLAEPLALAGIPVELLDTAGLRDLLAGPTHEAERAGIHRTRTALAEAHHVLLIVDATLLGSTSAGAAQLNTAQPNTIETDAAHTNSAQPDTTPPGLTGPHAVPLDLPQSDSATLESLGSRPFILVLNKIDVLSDSARTQVRNAFPSAALVSATTGEGTEDLRATLERHLTTGAPSADATLVTSLRQHAALTAALTALEAASQAAAASLPHEMIMVDLYTALTSLDELTGTTTPDSILHEIFSTFCIGK